MYMKWLKRVFLGLLVLIVVLVVAFNIWRERFLLSVVEAGGGAVLGVPVKVEAVDYRFFRGLVRVKGLEVGNPAGFKTERAIRVGEITVAFLPRSIFSDTLIIKRVYVNAPDITYELGLAKSNIGRILEQVEGSGAKENVAEKPAKKDPGGKKVVIEDLLIEHGHVHLGATLAGGVAVPIHLPSIHMTDVGKESGSGASVVEVVKKVMGSILGAVTHAATGAVGAVGGGAKAVGNEAVKLVHGGVTGVFKSGDAEKAPKPEPTP
jgi:hypothetical protein